MTVVVRHWDLHGLPRVASCARIPLGTLKKRIRATPRYPDPCPVTRDAFGGYHAFRSEVLDWCCRVGYARAEVGPTEPLGPTEPQSIDAGERG